MASFSSASAIDWARRLFSVVRAAVGRVRWRLHAVRAALWLGGLSAAGAAWYVAWGLFQSINVNGVWGIADDFAVNVAATAVGATLAYWGFLLRVRAGSARKLRRDAIRDPSAWLSDRSPLPPLPEDSGPARVGVSVVQDVLRPGISRSVVALAERSGGRRAFLLALTRELARRRFMPVPVGHDDVERHQDVESAARATLCNRFTAMRRSPADAERLWYWLLRHGKAVLVVDGLDDLAPMAGPIQQREVVSAALDELVAKKIPFVAILDPRRAPPVGAASQVRVDRLRSPELTSYFRSAAENAELNPDVVSRSLEAIGRRAARSASDPYILELALELAREAEPGSREGVLVDLLGVERRLPREMNILQRRLVSVTPIAERTRLTLAAIGRVQLVIGREAVLWRECLDVVLPAERDVATLGLRDLERMGIAAVSSGLGEDSVRMRDPVWTSYAGGLGVGPHELDLWSAILGGKASDVAGRAFSFCLSIAATNGVPVTAAEAVLIAFRDPGWPRSESTEPLRVLAAVYDGLVGVEPASTLDDVIAGAADKVWSGSDDDAKTLFVEALDLGDSPRLTWFLWQRLLPPHRSENSRPVRLAICRQLASWATPVWAVLGTQWWALVRDALDGDLSATGTSRQHWDAYGPALAHLAWLLPTLADRHESGGGGAGGDGPVDLVQFLTTSLLPGDGHEPGHDIGLEISLVEGFKFAIEAGPRLSQGSPWLETFLLHALRCGRSWYSKQVALHALALGAAGEGFDERTESVVREIAEDRHEHPLASEAARLLLPAPRRARADLLDNSWRDETTLLNSAGAGLSAAAHNLLAASTLLANLGEEIGKRGYPAPGADEDPVLRRVAGQRLREQAFVAQELPRCFRRSAFSSTMAERECTCDFKLCGRRDLGLGGPRSLSAAFLRRAYATANVRTAVRSRRLRRSGMKGAWAHLNEASGPGGRT